MHADEEKFYRNISLSFNRWLCDTNCTFEYYINGTFPAEVVLVALVVPGFSLLISLLPPIVFALSYRRISHAIAMNVFALLILTVLSDYLRVISVGMLCTVLPTLYFVIKQQKSTLQKEKSSNRYDLLDINIETDGEQVPYLADYRCNLLLATAVSILAVDFPILPERHSKTDGFGWSVMDAGVGSFVFIHGICSYEARRTKRGSFRKALTSSIPLLLLGFGRLFTVSAVGYHKSVTEYGIHWNFFFTLAATKVIGSILNQLFNPTLKSGAIALILLALHQWVLCCHATGLILSEDRQTLFKANKEGILSLLGFVTIYLIGVEIGKIIWKPRCKMREYLSLLVFFTTVGVIGWTVMLILHITVQPVSRRMANSSYCIWMVCLSCLQLAFHLLEHLVIQTLRHICKENLCQRHKVETKSVKTTNLMSEGINYNGLFYFLLANILTGLVNIFSDPKGSSEAVSVIVMSGYLSVLLVTALFMFRFSIQIKFW